MARRRRRSPRVFFAYPSAPASLVETIKAVGGENKRFSQCKGPDMGEICSAGKNVNKTHRKCHQGYAQIFACDVTYPNFNVLYELGFAIGRGKRLWPCKDVTVDPGRIIEGVPLNALVHTGLHSIQERYVDLASEFLEKLSLGMISRRSFLGERTSCPSVIRR